jgi:hypothetical protein
MFMETEIYLAPPNLPDVWIAKRLTDPERVWMPWMSSLFCVELACRQRSDEGINPFDCVYLEGYVFLQSIFPSKSTWSRAIDEKMHVLARVCPCKLAQVMIAFLNAFWNKPRTRLDYIDLVWENNWIWGRTYSSSFLDSSLKPFLEKPFNCRHHSRGSSELSSLDSWCRSTFRRGGSWKISYSFTVIFLIVRYN